MTNWTSERLLLKRELDQRLYGINTYYLARWVRTAYGVVPYSSTVQLYVWAGGAAACDDRVCS